MCQGSNIFNWQKECLSHLLKSGNVSLALVIMDGNNVGVSKSILNKIWYYKKSIIYLVYRTLIPKCKAQNIVDISDIINGIPTIRCETINKRKYFRYFKDIDIEIIKSYHLDFVILFNFGIIRGDILNTARFGVWSFNHGDEMKYRGRPPGFWELYNGENVTEAILQRLNDSLDGRLVLKHGFFNTINYSYVKQIDSIFAEIAYWPSEVCLDIVNGVAGYVDAPPSKTTTSILRKPNNYEMIKFIIKMIYNKLKHFYFLLFKIEQWNIGVVTAPISSFITPGYQPEIRYLSAPSQRCKFLADPFGVSMGEKMYILCEEYDYRDYRGVISCIELIGDNFHFLKKNIFEASAHQSYPYLFKYDEKYYCIPQTQDCRELDLFVALEFPIRWKRVATLIKDFIAVDSTIFPYEGKWWLFCTSFERGPSSHLYVWWAEDIWGPWMSHARNPVKMDVRWTRPAGTPFVFKRNLYRPTQGNSISYGGHIVINKIMELSPTNFREEPVATIHPRKCDPFPDGLHHLCQCGDLTLVDGKREIFIYAFAKRRLLDLLRRFGKC